MSIIITKHPVKKPTIPHISADAQLHPKLNAHPLLQCLNRYFFMIVMGRPGSGKSSFVYSVLTNPRMLAGVFERLYIVMPESSLESFGEDSKFSEINETQIYHELTAAVLDELEKKVDSDHEKGYQTCILMDDVQNSLKDRHVHLRLLHLVANRRHKGLSLILVAQTYKRIPLAVRQVASDLFCFNLSKENMSAIFDELIEIDKDKWLRFLRVYRTFVETENPKAFLYVNLITQKVFIDWENEMHDVTPENIEVVGLNSQVAHSGEKYADR